MKKAISIVALLVTAIAGTAFAHDHDEEEFVLSINAPSAKATSKGTAKLKITPKGKFHINLEYPTKLTINAPNGVTVEKAKQTPKDAAKFDQSAAEFDIGFTSAAAGKKSFTGELKFAVCEADSACHPHVEKIAFDVDVK